MSEKKKKSNINSDATIEETEYVEVSSRSSAARQIDTKPVRRVNPIGMRVLVSLRKDTNQTEGGLYLPEGAKANLQESLLAEVLEVASAIDDETDEETNVSGIPLGALVLISKHAGVKIPWDENLRLVDTKEVLAIVNEINLS